MHLRQATSIPFLLLVLVLVSDRHAAQAQERWPPWQSYGEAEDGAHARLRHKKSNAAADLRKLNHQIEQLRQAGKIAEAIPLAQRAVTAAERQRGPTHPDVAKALDALAALYIAQNKLSEAEPLLKRSLAIREKTTPPNNSDLVRALDKLAELYEKQGRSADANQLLKRAAAIREQAATDSSGVVYKKKSVVPFEPDVVEGKLAKPTAPVAATTSPADKPESPDAGKAGETHPEPLPTASDTAPEANGLSPELRVTTDAHGRKIFKLEYPLAVMGKEPTAEEQKDWDVVPVFYGTDRARGPSANGLSYNADRAQRLELGQALVTVPRIHQVPEIERPWAIRIPYFDVTIYEQAEDPKKHFTLQEIKSLSKEDFLRLVRERLATSSTFKDHALVFVHGYDTSFDNALYRTAQIAYDLRFDGAPFLYSWPSGGAVVSYPYDRESAEGSEPYLHEFLDLVVKETGAKTISVIAHSMGSKPLLDVLKDMKSAAPEGVVISQIILAAPDVDANTFTNLARAITGLAKGVTLYAASNDRALLVSRNFWGNYRAGDVPASGPIVLPGIDTIDVTAASTDVFALNHSEYAENNALLSDIGKLIESGLRPPDARLDKLKPVASANGSYWRYAAP